MRALLRLPMVVAPMAGGPSTTDLVVAAAEAGALGFLAAGYKSPDGIAAEIEDVRARTTEAFGVNVFVPGQPARPEVVARYLEEIAADAAAHGASLGEAGWDDDGYEAKIETLVRLAPPVVSFTFGCPTTEVVRAVQGAGSAVVLTVTTVEEAALALGTRPDALCLQGVEAGAHRGTYANDDHLGGDMTLLSLLGEVRDMTGLPLVGAGGVVRRAQVRAVLGAGATAVQCGTAFLRCPESGANATYKAALVDPAFTTTALTRAFSGRPARGLVNRFMTDHRRAPAAYPEINNATRPMRSAAAAAGDAHHMSLFAGQGFRVASDRPAGAIIDELCSGEGT